MPADPRDVPEVDPFAVAAGLVDEHGALVEPEPAYVLDPDDDRDPWVVAGEVVEPVVVDVDAELEDAVVPEDEELADDDDIMATMNREPAEGETPDEKRARLAANHEARLRAPGAEAVRTGSTENGHALYDWERVKRRYVEGVYSSQNRAHEWPNLVQVAGYFGIGLQSVRRKSAEQGWVGQRQKWQATIETTRQTMRATSLARSGMEVDDKALDAAKLGIQLCLARLGEIGEAAKAKRAATAGSGGQTGIDALEMGRLASAVELWHKVGMRAIGDPSDTTRVEFTGAGGAPIEIVQELKRDDPNRLTTVLAVLDQAGLGDIFGRSDDDPRAALGPGGGDGPEPPAGAY